MQEHFSPLTATVSLLVAPVTPVTSCSRKEPIFWCYMLVLSTQKTETRRICANTMAKSPSSLTPTHSLSLSSATPLPPHFTTVFPTQWKQGGLGGSVDSVHRKMGQIQQENGTQVQSSAHEQGAELRCSRTPGVTSPEATTCRFLCVLTEHTPVYGKCRM